VAFAAISAYSDIEKEIMTFHHESILFSSKVLFSQGGINKLAERKRDAGVIKPGDLSGQVIVPFGQETRLFKKNRGQRKSFEAQFYNF